MCFYLLTKFGHQLLCKTLLNIYYVINNDSYKQFQFYITIIHCSIFNHSHRIQLSCGSNCLERAFDSTISAKDLTSYVKINVSIIDEF